jgi:phage baseplate assembly protein W
MAGGFGFPFAVSPAGSIAPGPDEDADLRGAIVQVLFTSPGERVNQPEFGCGLLDLVFDPADTVLVSALEFTVGQALTQWLGDRLVVRAVDVTVELESISVEVAYLVRSEPDIRTARITFS